MEIFQYWAFFQSEMRFIKKNVAFINKIFKIKGQYKVIAGKVWKKSAVT